MNVLFVHRGCEVASARVRVLDLLPYLEARGVRCRAVAEPRGARELHALVRGERPDVFVLQKRLPTLGDAWIWRRRRARLVYDFDDAVMFRQAPRDGSHRSGTRARRFARVRRCADAFVCGNDYLASFVAGEGKPVLVAPSAVPLDVPVASPRAPGAPVRLGWLGRPENLHSLAAVAPALRRVAGERRVRLVVVSEETIDLPGVEVEHVPWRLEAQASALARLDVGLMPLEDSPWSRGKCAYKVLRYMAAGVPVVASPVGMNSEVVEDGANGLLAASADDWHRALLRLVDDPALAARLGAAGRARLAGRYDYPTVADAWRRFLAEEVASA